MTWVIKNLQMDSSTVVDWYGMDLQIQIQHKKLEEDCESRFSLLGLDWP